MSPDAYAQLVEIDLLHRRSTNPLPGRAPALVLWRAGSTPVAHTMLRPGPRARIARDALARDVATTHAEHLLRLAVRHWLRRGSRNERFALDAALADLADDITVPASAPGLTIAVCTRGRMAVLGRALDAIAGSMRHDDELLVVLNARDDDPHQRTTQALAAQWPRARFVEEPRPGLSWARNRALQSARHDLVLFTDDDCVPDPRWIDTIRDTMSRNPDADLLTGRVEPLTIDTAAQWQFEAYRGFPGRAARRWILAPDQPVIAPLGGQLGAIGAGANFAVRRRLVHHIGGFDAALGAGTSSGGGEDVEFFFRALKAGALVVCTPDAMVRHEHRPDAAALEQQLHAWSRGFACAIERIMIAHPEERAALRRYRTRVAVLHHGRRALWSSWRRLARAEWSGMRHADRVYEDARRAAERIATQIASTAGDTPPQHPILPLRRASVPTTVAWSLDIAEPFGPVEVGERADRVCITLHAGARVCGQLTLPVRHGVVGSDRVIDAITADTGDLAASLLGMPWSDARAHVQQWLERAVAM